MQVAQAGGEPGEPHDDDAVAGTDVPEGCVPGRSRTGGAVGDVEEDSVAPGGEESTGLGGAGSRRVESP
ncbi:hypothetical protein GCM10027073_59680 [Streptomyces chlorus]